MKRYLGIFILTVMVGLSGCASDTDSDTQVSSRAYSMQIQQNQNRVQTFNGRRQIRSSDGSMWTPPAGDKVAPGDVLLGLPSSGVHSNGFSLVRKICFEVMNYDMSTEIPEFGCSLGEKLLTPTRLYPKSCLPLIEKFDLHGMVHITGGGFYDNIPRILPEKCDAEINAAAWEIPVVFKKLQEWGNVPWAEMYRTFNMGVGMVLVVAPEEADAVRSHLTSAGEPFYELGNVVAGNKKAIMKGGVFSE